MLQLLELFGKGLPLRLVVNPWSRRNRSRRVQIAIEQGQMDLAEGRWASAERHLHRAAEAERQPLLYYL
ncbi:heme biosynthesis HemY N-terminal domain-containing protein, partial [Klebsiella pneumoniae]|uniref:heme biosynthesis HemY N-terminal domain-containing protein n=1 Tax=Klebsiella pneumoniae TaxID=573 RepID=UPI0027306C94